MTHFVFQFCSAWLLCASISKHMMLSKQERGVIFYIIMLIGWNNFCVCLDTTNLITLIETYDDSDGALRRIERAIDRKQLRELNSRSYRRLLHIVAAKGFIDICELLLDKGVDINDRDDCLGLTPLQYSASGCLLETCRYLIDRGANVELQSIATRGNSGTETTALHCLIQPVSSNVFSRSREYLPISQEKLVQVGRLLIDRGADVNKKDNRGWTPLGLSSLKGYVAFSELLISRGASLHVGVGERAIATGSLKTIKLPKFDDEIYSKYGSGSTPLHIAAGEGHIQLCSVLLEHRVDTEVADGSGATVLHVSSKYGHIDIAKLLLSRGANIHALDSSGETPLHVAASAGHTEICAALLDRGADVNFKSPVTGATALLTAATNGRLEVCRLLLVRGADTSCGDYHGVTALHRAVRFAVTNRAASVTGTNINTDVQEKASSLASSIQLCRLLLEETEGGGSAAGGGGSAQVVNAIDSTGATALHLAAQYGLSSICGMLIAKGASPVVFDNKGQTALHLAAMYGYSDVHTDILCQCYCGEDSVQSEQKQKNKMVSSARSSASCANGDKDEDTTTMEASLFSFDSNSCGIVVESSNNSSSSSSSGERASTGIHTASAKPRPGSGSLPPMPPYNSGAELGKVGEQANRTTVVSVLGDVDDDAARGVLALLDVIRAEYIEILDLLLRTIAATATATTATTATANVDALVGAATATAVNTVRVSDGATPLHLAAQSGFTDAFLPLLKFGADPCMKDVAGKSPVEWARNDVVRSVLCVSIAVMKEESSSSSATATSAAAPAAAASAVSPQNHDYGDSAAILEDVAII